MPNPVSQAVTAASRLALMPLTWWQLWWAATETVTYRLAMVANAGLFPDVALQREYQRMVDEKAAAARESTLIMQRAFARSGFASPLTPWRQWLLAVQSGAELQRTWLREAVRWQQSLGMGAPLLLAGSRHLEPWRRRAVANARRLRRAHQSR